jgi:predicted transcriptional regulator
MANLFANLAKSFSIARVTAADAKKRSDRWYDLKKLIQSSEGMYPRIGEWVENKVRGGLQGRGRAGFVGYHNGVPVVSSVVKHGMKAKFCHLKVDEKFRDSNIGECFFALMAMEIKGRAREVHFTLPENLWSEKKDFFSSFEFKEAVKSDKQYRLFADELHCSARYEDLWNAVTRKLPKLRSFLEIDRVSADSELVMSVRAVYANAILQGKKTVEVRKAFSSRWLGSRIALYASAPAKSLVGEAVIADIVKDTPAAIWGRFADDLGCTKEEFDKYTSGIGNVFAIVMGEVRQYSTPLTIDTAGKLIGERMFPPQNYSKLGLDSPWSRAVPLASLLQGASHQHENRIS